MILENFDVCLRLVFDQSSRPQARISVLSAWKRLGHDRMVALALLQLMPCNYLTSELRERPRQTV